MTDNPIDTSPSAVVVLTKQLHSPQLNDDMMRRWDALRAEIANGNHGSHPRDIFESIIDSIDEERSEAAYFLEDLAAKLGEAEKERDEVLAQLAEARRENERLDRCLAFFASVIKSGEPWTETCEREYAAASSSLPQH